MKTLITIFALSLSLNNLWAGAGDSGNCDSDNEPTAEEQLTAERHQQVAFERAFALMADLDSKGAEVAVISRATTPRDNRYRLNGRNFNMFYGHAGIIYKENGIWQIRHLLNNSCENGAKSSLHKEGVARFWPGNIAYYDISVKIPSVEVQEAMLEILHNEERLDALHNDNYNSIGNPFSPMYQNSNGYILAIVASAISGVERFGQGLINAYTQLGYVALQSKLTRTDRIGINLLGMKPDSVSFDDKPAGWNKRQFFDFVSAESIERFIDSADNGGLFEYELSPNEGYRISAEDLRTSRF